jgi:creatinine amidohydrolase
MAPFPPANRGNAAAAGSAHGRPDAGPVIGHRRGRYGVKISEMNWFQVEDYLRHDDRAVIPLGSTEQHCHLSLSVDSILSERVAVEAAEPLGVPVFPVLAYGITPYFMAYPGTVSIRLNTYAALIGDVLGSLYRSGFRRILLCNGHGGNSPAQTQAIEWMSDHPGGQVRFHNWWNAPRTFAKVQEIDKVASHASWMENFPWTRLPNLRLPEQQKPMIDLEQMRVRDPKAVRDYLGDGNFGGLYQRSDDDMLAIWSIAVAETREQIDRSWS